jgi:TRAP-type C4-dicarboxylate transport system substrate-binding protein
MKAFKFTAAALFAASSLFAQQSMAVETITVHHFLSPKAPQQTKLIEPWAKALEEQSNGELKVEIFPSMALGGKPPELYRQVRDGAVDVAWTLIGYTPGVFPRSEVFELPTVHTGSAGATTLAIQDMVDMVADDFKDVKLLLLHVHEGNAIHTVDKKITSMDDLKGMKLRTPSRTGAWVIESWEAEPVGMPLPALPQALSKNAVDGGLVPFEIFPPLKLHQLTKYSHEANRFGTSVFLFVMNKDRYEGLSDELKAVIDANSGAALAGAIGEAWTQVEEPGRKLQLESGGEIVEMSPELIAELDKRGETVVARWIEEMQSQGIDGQALVDAARANIAKHSK